MGKLKIFPISIRISERDLSVFTGVLALPTFHSDGHPLTAFDGWPGTGGSMD